MQWQRQGIDSTVGQGQSTVWRRQSIEVQRIAVAEHSLTIQSKGRVEFSKGIVKLRIAKAELCVAENGNGEGEVLLRFAVA